MDLIISNLDHIDNFHAIQFNDLEFVFFSRFFNSPYSQLQSSFLCMSDDCAGRQCSLQQNCQTDADTLVCKCDVGLRFNGFDECVGKENYLILIFVYPLC